MDNSPNSTYWSERQTDNLAIAVSVSSGLTLVSTMLSFVLLLRDSRWSKYPLTSKALLTVFIGDFIYACTLFTGTVGYFVPMEFFNESQPRVCVAWGSFIYFGHNLVFFSLVDFFVCSYADTRERRWTELLKK